MAITTHKEWINAVMDNTPTEFNVDTLNSIGAYTQHANKGNGVDPSHFTAIENTVSNLTNISDLKTSDLPSSTKRLLESLSKNQAKDVKSQLKGVYKELHEAVTAHQKAINVLSDSYAIKSLQNNAQNLFNQHVNEINKQLKSTGAFDKATGLLTKDILNKDGIAVLTAGQTREEATQFVSDLSQRFASSVREFNDAVVQQVEHHANKIGDLKSFAGNLETDSGHKVKDLIGKELGEAYKGPITHGSTTATAGAHQHTPTEVHTSHVPGSITYTLGGAAAGAAVGYVMSGDDNKATGTTVGGIVGGIAGEVGRRTIGKQVVGALENATSSLGASMHGNAAARMLETAVSHIR